MNFAWNLDLGTFITSLLLIIVFYGLLFVMFAKNINKKMPFVILGVLFLVSLTTFLLQLIYPFILCCVLTMILSVLVVFLNLNVIRKAIVVNHKKVEKNNQRIEKIFDRDACLKEVESAVISFSKSKTGALITFTKSDSLSDAIKNGVFVNAPVTAELLETIFYPGTRLHDGAVIISDGNITSAAVFFTPSTKSFAVKYGSRHRAAIGVSEISDSVTVVVSEETGRISIVVDGRLESVTPENFLRVLNTYLKED